MAVKKHTTSQGESHKLVPRYLRVGTYLVNTMVGVTARLVSVAVKDHDLDDHVTEGE